MGTIILIWLTWLCWWISNLILNPKVIGTERLFSLEEKRGRFQKKFYQETKKKNFKLSSDYGYDLSCELLEREESKSDNKKIVVLCHGFSNGKYGCLIYAEMYLQLGFRVVIYDHRNHGMSGRAHTSMGFYEKYDLKKVVDWCFEHFGQDVKLITHGESMGAATVLLHLGIDSRVKAVIADCGYSDLKILLQHHLRRYYHLPRWIVPMESLITYLRAGFWYREVSPINVVRNTDTPILFIHGKEDRFVPTYMSKRMYQAKEKNKGLYLVAHAKHGESCWVSRKKYSQQVESFLRKYLKG